MQKNEAPELFPVRVDAVLSEAHLENLNFAFKSIQDNLPPQPVITETESHAYAIVSDRRVSEGEAVIAAVALYPSVLVAPQNIESMQRHVVFNDQIEVVIANLEAALSLAKQLRFVNRGQIVNQANFAKFTVNLFANTPDEKAKLTKNRIEAGLKKVADETAATSKLSAKDKKLLKETKAAMAMQKNGANKTT